MNSNGIKDWWKTEETTSLYQSDAQTPQSYSWKPYSAEAIDTVCLPQNQYVSQQNEDTISVVLVACILLKAKKL